MSNTLSTKSYSLKIGWLYPDLMSTYGDRGNIIVLKKRCEWRNINVEIVNIDQNTADSELKSVNILFGGGAQDKEQHIVMENLRKKKKQIKNLIEADIPTLLVCGSPQLFGKYYEPSFGKRIEGLGIFDMLSIHPGPVKDRLIGNIVAKVNWENLDRHPEQSEGSQRDSSSASWRTQNDIIVGFENHGGRTYLGESARPFARVLKGNGNNGEDGTEGVVYKNAIGSYLHGPILPKNPEIADWLIKKALEIKYNKNISLNKIDDATAKMAKIAIAERLGVKI